MFKLPEFHRHTFRGEGRAPFQANHLPDGGGGGAAPRWQNAIYCLVCLLVIGIFAWSAQTGALESASLRAQDSYYNLLVQGFQAGQLNVKRQPSPGLAKLADPYDPSSNTHYVWDPHHLAYEMSYYRDKLYLYFGVTPALVLFWPYAAFTGHYLWQKQAVVIFLSLGFLAAAGLLHAIWRRYFPAVSVWMAAAGLFALGLATGILELLSACDVYEVAKSCAFAFTMLALACLWRALHASKGQIIWLLLASTAYGLAVGSRPAMLFGAIILLVPAARAWLSPEPMPYRRGGLLLAAAAFPLLLAGMGLMIYNFRRFGNPFEFGWHYQLTDHNNTAARQFSLSYLFSNVRFYFLQPVRWTGHFPFLEGAAALPAPSGYWGFGAQNSGILLNYPVVWLALASFLVWKKPSPDGAPGLRWFILAAALLFALCALTLCLFFAGSTSYELDFLPALMLLAIIGIFSLERALASSLVWRRAARAGWCLLLAYSIIFNVLAAAKAHADADYFTGILLVHQGRTAEASAALQRAVALNPDSADIRLLLAVVDDKTGHVDETINQLRKALELRPRFAEAEYALSLCFLETGQKKEALESLERTVAFNPDSADFRLALAAAYDASGRRNDAINELHRALEIKPGSAEAEYCLGDDLLKSGQAPESFAHFQKALAIDPGVAEAGAPVENNNAAWWLATDPEPANRNGPLAVDLALDACQRTHYQATGMVGTLAAAYAESGRFEDAISTVQKAIALAKEKNQTYLLQKNQELLRLYQKHIAYHESESHAAQ